MTAEKEKLHNIFRAAKIAAGACFCIILLAGAQKAESADPAYSSAQIYQFAMENYKAGDFLTAAIEFKRFEHFYPVEPMAAEASFMTGMSYFQIPRYWEAISAFEQTAGRYQGTGYASEAMFMISRCYAGLNNIDQALRILDSLSQNADSRQDRDRARYRSAVLRLESGKIPEARKSLEAVSRQNRDRYNVDRILRDLDEPGAIKTKSPFLAGIFSVIPGGGYLYTGRSHDALTAFFLTAGLAVASWEAFDNDMYALGTFAGLAGAGFYGGSAMGGISSAHKYNREKYRDYVSHINETGDGPGISFKFGAGSAAVLLCFNF